jgi:hypothetical protein
MFKSASQLKTIMRLFYLTFCGSDFFHLHVEFAACPLFPKFTEYFLKENSLCVPNSARLLHLRFQSAICRWMIRSIVGEGI